MSSTRDSILRTLRTRGPRAISELAKDFGITAASIRHHLAALQAEGLVEAKEVRHGVGRPHLAYRLTDAALER